MEGNDTIDDGATKQEASGLASSRSRRERNPRAAKSGRFAALEELKVNLYINSTHMNYAGL